MIDDLRAIAIFAETIRQGSFRGAARKLDLSPSTISYNITELERRIGTVLLYRSTRKLALTHEGERLYKHAADMLFSAEKGLSEVTSDGGELRGKLNITATSALMRSRLNQHIAAFHLFNPAIELHISYSDVRQDMIAESIDVAFRAGEMHDSSLKSKRVGQINRKLVCSKNYFEARKPPSHPNDLASWQWVGLEMMPNHRTLCTNDGPTVSVTVEGNVRVNSVEAMTQFCIQGLGLSTPPDYHVEKELAEGSLVEVLPDWSVTPIPLYAVWPENTVTNKNTRQLVDYVTAAGKADI